jgi:hypothetical protein
MSQGKDQRRWQEHTLAQLQCYEGLVASHLAEKSRLRENYAHDFRY